MSRRVASALGLRSLQLRARTFFLYRLLCGLLASLTTGIAWLRMRGCAATFGFSLRLAWLRGGRWLRCFGLGVASVGFPALLSPRLVSVMFSSFASVGFCGSRSLPASARPLVSSVVRSVLSGSRAFLAVGCSVGADSFVLSSVPPSSLSRLSVFAAFGFGGTGSCRVSAVSAVLAAARGGASVRWWAGGLPSVSLRQRLALRSVALVRSLACHPPSALVCFLSSPRSRGSLLACRLAAQCGVPVFVFCVGFSPARLPRLRRGGSWSLVQVAGLQAVRWQAGK